MSRLPVMVAGFPAAPLRLKLDRLRRSLTATYAVLDPMLPAEGAYVSGWRLRVNVSPDELEAVRRT